MKKLLLFSAVLLAGIQMATAQGYWYVQQTGTTGSGYEFTTAGTTILGIPSSQTLSSWQTLPFSWEFFGQTVDGYYASDNGYITFDQTATTSVAVNAVLPSASGPNNAIFALWDDLDVVAGAGSPDAVNAWTYGDAPNRVHVIQWFSCTQQSSGAWVYAAIRIYEGGSFDLVYSYCSNAVTSDFTIGIQNADGTQAVMLPGAPITAYPNLGAGADGSDDVVLSFFPGTQPDDNLSHPSVNIDRYIQSGGNAPIIGQVVNLGTQPVTSFDVSYTVNGGTAVTESFTGLNIAPLGTYSYTFNSDYSSSVRGKKDFVFFTSNVNGGADGYPTDDTTRASAVVFETSDLTDRAVLLESFTSSTCGPCNAGNANVDNVLAAYTEGEDFTNVRYQMSWPGTGDPYYTAEGFVRRAYYGVNSIPQLLTDGGNAQNSGGLTSQEVDAAKAQPTFMEIDFFRASIDTSTKKVYIEADISTTLEAYSPSAKVQVAVIERTTYNNIKTNGETEFYNVMKKMLPDAAGTDLGMLSESSSFEVNQQWSFPGVYRLGANANDPIDLETEHSVETWDDLAVVVWVEDQNKSEVFQSAIADLDMGPFETELDGQTVYVIGDDTFELFGSELVPLGLAENGLESNWVVFPNPAQDQVNVTFSSSADDASIALLNAMGAQVLNEQIVGASGSLTRTLDISELPSGVYFVQIRSGETVQTKKLVLEK